MNPDPFDDLTTSEIQTAIITAAANLVGRWTPRVPGAEEHIKAGAGIAIEVTLRPVIRVSMQLIDSDEKRYELAFREFGANGG